MAISGFNPRNKVRRLFRIHGIGAPVGKNQSVKPCFGIRSFGRAFCFHLRSFGYFHARGIKDPQIVTASQTRGVDRIAQFLAMVPDRGVWMVEERGASIRRK